MEPKYCIRKWCSGDAFSWAVFRSSQVAEIPASEIIPKDSPIKPRYSGLSESQAKRYLKLLEKAGA